MARTDPCPFCGSGPTVVRDSRSMPAGRWRRRGCEACGHRWGTLEILLERQGSALTTALARSLRNAKAIVADLSLLVEGMPEDPEVTGTPEQARAQDRVQ